MTGKEETRLPRRHWMPGIVLLIGLLSIVLLWWVDRINEELRNAADLSHAVVDLKYCTAMYHFKLEEGVEGKMIELPLPSMVKGIALADALLKGGETGCDLISEPLRSPELRRRMEEIKADLLRLQEVGSTRLQYPAHSAMGSALENQFDTLFMDIVGRSGELEALINSDKTEYRGKSKRLFTGIVIIWAAIVFSASIGLWYRESQRKIAEMNLLEANRQLLADAEELSLHQEHLKELVALRTAELTVTNNNLRLEIAGHERTEGMLKETERQIRHLLANLIDAQEIERKRISMGLHDELGQSLNVTKLRIRLIERGLKKDQEGIRNECEELLAYLNQVIEDVRRLSRNLSPIALEDIGLTSAIRLLIGNAAENPSLQICSDIDDIDPFPEQYWIAVYRVLQEALTNISKHAGSAHVHITIRLLDNQAVFTIEDDGNGFDMDREWVKEAGGAGLGLTTMRQRVRMMGGALEVWSRAGKGTRITFSLPFETKAANHENLSSCRCG